jgi:integrase
MFDPIVEKFLGKKNPGTRSIYRAGIIAFAEFYKPQGSIPDFLDRLEADRGKGWRENKHIASDIMTDFVEWLQTEKKFSRKTTRAYAGAIQQFAKFNDLPFSIRDTKLPVSNPDLKKFNWTGSDVVRFFNLFEDPMYRSFGILIFQSFFDRSTTLELQYSDISKEYEANLIPLCLDTERFKTGIPFMSFLGQWGVKELHKYLDTRGALKPEDLLFPTTKQELSHYFRDAAETFLKVKFKKDERSPCGTHSLRASGSTLARDNLTGDAEHIRAADRYIDFFMGKTVPEQQRVYMSKSRDSWRETYRVTVEPFVTPSKF